MTRTTGELCVSIDLELAWGTWDKPSERTFRACAERERDIVRALLELFERHEVPATWAVVGRLLERDAAAAARTSWGESIWYAPDVVEAIRDAQPRHDIGSHGYAHIYFGESTRDALAADLAAVRRVHAAHGLPTTSFVFPRNQIAHVDLLPGAGISVFRGADTAWGARLRGALEGSAAGRAANLVDKALPVPPPPARVRRAEGNLVEVPGSLLLIGRGGIRRLVRPAALYAKARLGLEWARRSGGLFHLWFHPSNFYDDTDVQLGVLDDILAAAARLRARGALAVRTMADYARA